MKLLTVIVPSYNTSKYINGFMKSIVDERYMDKIEILFVNDGSKDDTQEIINLFINQYPDTVNCCQKENGGHGSTINIGTRLAKGKYFKVIDGDDYVDKDEFFGLLNQLEDVDADMFVSVYDTVSYTTGKVVTHYPNEFSLVKKYVDFDLYDNIFKADDILDYIYAPLHACTFKTSVFVDNNILVSEHVFFEDNEYVLFPIPYVDTIFVSHYNVYKYLVDQATQSVSMESKQKRIKQLEMVTMNCLAYYNSKKEFLSEEKKHYLIDGIAALIYCVFEVYLSFRPINADVKKNIVLFDKKIKFLSDEVYKRSWDYKLVKSTRVSYRGTCILLDSMKHFRNSLKAPIE